MGKKKFFHTLLIFPINSFPPHFIGYIFPGKHKAKEQINIPSAMVTIEAFLDLTCPYSRKGYETLKSVIHHYNEQDKDRSIPSVQLRLIPAIIPWHGPGTVCLAKAAGLCFLVGGNSLLFDFVDLCYENMDKFTSENIYNKSVREIWEDMIGKDLVNQLREKRGHSMKSEDFMDLWTNHKETVVELFKHNHLYNVQNSIRKTPTVCINGLKYEQIKSEWSIDDYRALLDKMFSEGLAVPHSRG